MRTALPSLSSRLQRAAWLIASLVACAIVAPAHAQSVPARSLLAYTQTYASGRCVVETQAVGKRIVTVTKVVRQTFIYKPQSNHDPDDSNGTVIRATNK